MVYTVVCYKETGFSRGNIPSSPAVLENAAKITLQANQIWKLQDRFLSQVKLSMSWDDAQDVDYMKVGDNYYTVENVQMSNGNVAIFTIALDPITSVGGVSGFTLIDGWAQRMSPRSDDLFGNIIDEPWSPSEELISDPAFTVSGEGDGNYLIVGSTVDLTEDLSSSAKALTDGARGLDVVIPFIKPPTISTTVFIRDRLDNPIFGGSVSYQIPGGTLYDLTDETVQENIGLCYGMSMLQGISSSYRVPGGFVSEGPSGPVWLSIVNDPVTSVISQRPYEYGGYKPKNKKVYALYSDYLVMSKSSGASRDYQARELYHNDEGPEFVMYADLSPSGAPYFQPRYYEGRNTLMFQEAVRGSSWLNQQIVFKGQEGFIFDDASIRQSYLDMVPKEVQRRTEYFRDLVGGVAGGVGDAAVTAFGGVGNILSGDFGGAEDIARGVGKFVSTAWDTSWNTQRAVYDRAQYNIAEQQVNYNYYANRVKVPTFSFSGNSSTAMFVDNAFAIFHVHLKDSDMERLDNFLTMYGYAVSERLEQSDFTSHTHFNFVQANNVAVEGPSMFMCNLISDYFAGGVRLWHELPNRAAMSDNPIKGGA